MVDVTEKKGKIIIKGYGCPITRAVEADGRLCIAMAAMIGKLVGLPATEKCNRTMSLLVASRSYSPETGAFS